MLENNKETGSANLSAGHSSAAISYADSLENYRRNTDWWVVFATFDLPNFEPSPLWISQRTGLNVDTVVEALEGLSILGYLKKDGGSFYPVKGKDFVKFEVANRPKSEVFEEHTLIAHQVLNNMNENSLAAIDHRCFAADVEILKELYSDISKAFDKAYTKAQGTPSKDRVFKMTFTAVDVLKGKGRA